MTQMQHESAPRGLRLLRRWTIATLAVLIFAAMAARIYLNVTGFCYEQRRYLTEQEFLDVAAQDNINRYDPSGERNIQYGSPRDLYAANPNCCDVSHSPHHFLQESRFMRVF